MRVVEEEKKEEVGVLRLRGGGENEEWKEGMDPEWHECIHCNKPRMLWNNNECEEGKTHSDGKIQEPEIATEPAMTLAEAKYEVCGCTKSFWKSLRCNPG